MESVESGSPLQQGATFYTRVAPSFLQRRECRKWLPAAGAPSNRRRIRRCGRNGSPEVPPAPESPQRPPKPQIQRITPAKHPIASLRLRSTPLQACPFSVGTRCNAHPITHPLSPGRPLLNSLSCTASLGRPLLDGFSWTASVGRPLLDGLSWRASLAASLGRPLLDGFSWTASLGRAVLDGLS